MARKLRPEPIGLFFYDAHLIVFFEKGQCALRNISRCCDLIANMERIPSCRIRAVMRRLLIGFSAMVPP